MNLTGAGRISGMALIAYLVFCLPFFASAEQNTPKGLALPPVDEFIFKWQKSGGYESGASQMFITELCLLLDVPKPDAPRPELVDNTYVFEKAVERTGSTGRKSIARIDLWLKGRFIWESKQGVHPPDTIDSEPRRSGHGTRGTADHEAALFKARIQAQDYAPLLPEGAKNPPFVIVADIGYCFDLFADFRGSGEYTPFPSARENRIALEDLRKPEVQELFRKIWTDPLSLDPSREREKVTHDIALKLSALAKSLERSGHDTDTASLFIQRCIFVMFAEDCGLLPHDSFSSLLAKLEQTPNLFAPALTDLWRTMQSGGQSDTLGATVLRFGSFFENAQALTLNKEQLALLREAASANWSAVETSIFGTLLEQALTSRERHRLGAHYTPTAYVERLILPAIIKPERVLWEAAKDAALAKVIQGDSHGAIAEIETYYKHLAGITVLDPSCGSGNFLSVALTLLKDLEGEVVQALRVMGLSDLQIQQKGYFVGPHQMRGIEVVQRAADISELVLWISSLQRHYKIHGNITPPESILQLPRSVECRDALLIWDADGSVSRAAPWPKADYIIGNPPFIGSQRMRSALSDSYTEALREVYSELPGNIDFVMYWWHRAASLLQNGEIQQFGFITTNKIRQTNNQKIVERFLSATPPISFVYAIPDHPWMDDSQKEGRGRVSMGVCSQGKHQGVLAQVILERREGNFVRVNLHSDVGTINSKLTLGPSMAGLKPLRANQNISSRGMELRGSGFIVTEKEAQDLGLGSIPGLDKHIRPYRNGKDVADISRNLMVIDVFGLTSEEVKRRYPSVYQWLLDKVKPERDKNRRAASRNNWWIFGEARATFRPALDGLSRYIVTPETARRRYFVFLDKSVLPDNKLVAVASEDAYHLGILSSRIHKEWELATGGRLGIGNDLVYVKSICFDAFPFPEASAEQRARIRILAEAIDAHRKQRQALYPKLTMTDMYAVMEQMFYGVSLTPKEKVTSEQGDLPALIKLHADLDAAVADAYAWPATLTTDEMLARLLELNRLRAAEEKVGKIHWLRPKFQNPTYE